MKNIYLSRPVGLVEDAVCNINEDLMVIFNWMGKTHLSLNPSKSSTIMFHNNNVVTLDFPQTVLDSFALSYLTYVKDFGVIMSLIVHVKCSQILVCHFCDCLEIAFNSSAGTFLV